MRFSVATTGGGNHRRDQATETLWLKNSDDETRYKQYGATVAGLIGIEPRDELEGMLAAQRGAPQELEPSE